MNPLIKKITESQLRDDIPDFRAGDTVRVYARIVEGSRERIQVFEGVVIKRHGEGISETYTVRKMSSGIGVERTFPVHSPRVTRLKLFAVVVFGGLSCTTCVNFTESCPDSRTAPEVRITIRLQKSSWLVIARSFFIALKFVNY